MTRKPTTRPSRKSRCRHPLAAGAVLLALAGALPFAAVAQQQRQERPAPPQHFVSPAANTAQPRQNPAYPNSARLIQNNPVPSNPRQHLGEWMDAHRSLPLDQQQRALEQEPGFRQLRPDVQQHMRDRLTQLNNMSPERRQQAINRTEAMERLTPDQRQQVRNAAGQLGSLPEDRRRAVARAFHDLRAMPEAQRQGYLNSPQFRGQFNDQERSTLSNLMSVSPYLPLQQQPLPRPIAPAPYPAQPQF